MKMTQDEFRTLTGRCLGCGNTKQRHSCTGQWLTNSIIRLVEEVEERGRADQRADIAAYIEQGHNDGLPSTNILQDLRQPPVEGAAPGDD